jgi:hypothetical protein
MIKPAEFFLLCDFFLVLAGSCGNQFGSKQSVPRLLAPPQMGAVHFHNQSATSTLAGMNMNMNICCWC